MKIEFHPVARVEIREARRWYRDKSPVAAASFAHEVDRAIREIAENPDRFREDEDGNRRFFLNRFPFTVVYRSTGEAIAIIAVAHQKRRPRYWANRTMAR